MTDAVRQEIAQLRHLRERAAAFGRQLTERELDGRLLRERVAPPARAGGATKADAADAAKTAAEYLAWERATAALAEQRDLLLAECEALRLGMLLALAERSPEPVP